MQPSKAVGPNIAVKACCISDYPKCHYKLQSTHYQARHQKGCVNHDAARNLIPRHSLHPFERSPEPVAQLHLYRGSKNRLDLAPFAIAQKRQTDGAQSALEYLPDLRPDLPRPPARAAWKKRSLLSTMPLTDQAIREAAYRTFTTAINSLVSVIRGRGLFRFMLAAMASCSKSTSPLSTFCRARPLCKRYLR